MHIWLPPSEGKRHPATGTALDLPSLAFPELTGARMSVIEALNALGAGESAAQVLKLGKKSAADAADNLRILEAPCTSALELFTGVLFDHLNAASLPTAALKRLNENALIMTAPFGWVRPSDHIPPYRLAMGVSLPMVGPLARFWRESLAETTVGTPGEAIVDCRPGAYARAYPGADYHRIELGAAELRHGKRQVITHMAKKWRGVATRHLLCDTQITSQSTREQLLHSLASLAHREEILDVEIGGTQNTQAGGSRTIVTLITRSTATSCTAAIVGMSAPIGPAGLP